MVVLAEKDSWSRAARRKKMRGNDSEDGLGLVAEAQSTALTCQIACDLQGETVGLTFDWLRGKDRGLFEGFCGHVYRKVTTALGNQLT